MEDIVNVAANYFDTFFCADPCDQMEECLNAVSYKVTPELQQILSSDLVRKRLKRCCSK